MLRRRLSHLLPLIPHHTARESTSARPGGGSKRGWWLVPRLPRWSGSSRPLWAGSARVSSGDAVAGTGHPPSEQETTASRQECDSSL